MNITPYDAFIRYLMQKGAKMHFPVSGTLELTSRCTLDCKMCYIHCKQNDADALKNEKSTSWWLDLIEKMKAHGTLTVLITGGEPLLRPDFDEIYKACAKSGMIMQVNTNGTLITDKIIQLFKEYPPNVVNVTLYGASNETYKKLCGKEEFDRVYNAIKKLKAEGISVRVNYSITKINKDDFDKAVRLCEDISVPIRATSYMFPATRKCKTPCEEFRLSAAEAAAMSIHARELIAPEEFKKSIEAVKNNESLRLCDDDCMTLPGERISCMAGASSFWITYDGFLTPCGMLNYPRIELKSFDEDWESLKKCRSEIVLPEKCANCSLKGLCESCAAATKAETGSFDKVPEYLCEKTKAFYELIMKR